MSAERFTAHQGYSTVEITTAIRRVGRHLDMAHRRGVADKLTLNGERVAETAHRALGALTAALEYRGDERQRQAEIGFAHADLLQDAVFGRVELTEPEVQS